MPRQKNRENAQCRTCGLFKIDNKTKDIKPDCYSCYKKNMIELDADSETVNCQKCQTVQNQAAVRRMLQEQYGAGPRKRAYRAL